MLRYPFGDIQEKRITFFQLNTYNSRADTQAHKQIYDWLAQDFHILLLPFTYIIVCNSKAGIRQWVSQERGEEVDAEEEAGWLP